MTVVHLTASPFFGGPERQMLGLATHWPEGSRPVFLSFPERGLCWPFLGQLRRRGLEAVCLEHNHPHILKCIGDVAEQLRQRRAEILCCHGYKADIIGYFAGRRAGIPVVAVSRGWTAATRKVRFYEWLDRRVLRWMDAVACVSDGQAQKVRRCGVAEDRVHVIRNAIQLDRFDEESIYQRRDLEGFFPERPGRIVVAAGRLSVEKGFEHLVSAAAIAAGANQDINFILFGEGPLRSQLEQRIAELKLSRRFILAGFRDDVDRFLPHADLVVLPSLTEGLPNVALEAHAASVPVVATAVGGTPEVVVDNVTGRLVPAADPSALAGAIVDVLRDEDRRKAMGRRGREHVEEHFTFDAQVQAYQQLFGQLQERRGGQVSQSGQKMLVRAD